MGSDRDRVYDDAEADGDRGDDAEDDRGDEDRGDELGVWKAMYGVCEDEGDKADRPDPDREYDVEPPSESMSRGGRPRTRGAWRMGGSSGSASTEKAGTVGRRTGAAGPMRRTGRGAPGATGAAAANGRRGVRGGTYAGGS